MANASKRVTKLAFDGKIGKVAIGDGKAELTLIIDQPAPPPRPSIPYDFNDWKTQDWKPRPADVKRTKNETDEEYGARGPVAERKNEQARYDAARERWETDMADWRVRSERFSPRLMSYAGLVGIAAVFGKKAVNVVLTPADQDIMPGFAAMLAGENDVPQLGAADDEEE